MSAPEAELLLLLPDGRRRIPLGDSAVSIGSHPSCSISLQDADLAPHHAVVQLGERGYEIFDLRSRAGLRVNGHSVEATALRPGDQITAGGLQLVFLGKTASGSEEAPPPDAPAAPRRNLVRNLGALAGTLRAALRGALHARPEPLREAPTPPPHQPTTAPTFPRISAFHRRSFAEEMVQGLRTTPWLLTSLVLHLLLLILLDNLAYTPPERPQVITTRVAMDEGGPEVPSPDLRDEEAPVEEPAVEAEDLEDPEVADIPDLALEPLGDPGGAEGPGREDLTPLFEGPAPGDGGSFDDPGLRTGGGDRTTGFKRYVRGLKRSGLDIVFVIDSTGSMSSVLEDARQRVSEMIAVVAELVPAFRLGLVTYRDHGDREYVTRSVALTPHRYRVVHLLDELRAQGGGDLPEAVLSGLRAAVRDMGWGAEAQRIVVLLGDAPPHSNDLSRIMRLVRRFRSRGDGVLHCIYTPKGTAAFRRLDKMAKETAGVFKELARKGGGAYVELAQDEEILLQVLELAFGEEKRELMRRRIRQVRTGWKDKAYRRLVAQMSPSRLTAHLKRGSVSETLVRVLDADPQPDFLPAYLEVIADPGAPGGSRWAASVLARRLVASQGGSDPLIQQVSRLTPDLGAAELESMVRRFAEAAERAGMPARAPDPEVRADGRRPPTAGGADSGR